MRWFSTRRKTSTKSGLSSIQRRPKTSWHTARQCPKSSSFESAAGSSLPAAHLGGEKFICSLHELHHANHSRVLQLTKERRRGCSRRSLFRFHIPAHSWCVRDVAANGSHPSEPALVLVMETAVASSRRSAPPIAMSIRLSGTLLLSCTGIGPLRSFAKVRLAIVQHPSMSSVYSAEYRSWIYEQLVSSLPPSASVKTALRNGARVPRP
jgi:hypothetical protein